MDLPTPGTPYLLTEDDGPALWFLDNLVTLKATGATTNGALTVAQFVNPAGFAPPLHRHLVEDEMFHVLSGRAVFRCGEVSLTAGPGDFVLLPRGLPHSFRVSEHGPLRAIQLTAPSGFEDFAGEVGRPAAELRLPEPEPVDPAALGHAAGRHRLEILGPPPF